MDLKLSGREENSTGTKIGMTGTQRRNRILILMGRTGVPLSGSALGRETGVSRQVIVQDIALLRAQGYPIAATARGYVLDKARPAARLFKVRHNSDEIEDELRIIVDLGGCISDVMINHRVYGKVSALLNIKSRRDIEKFMNDIGSGKSEPLMNVTSGYHFHHVSAEQEETLDEIEEALRKRHYLAEFMPYEKP